MMGKNGTLVIVTGFTLPWVSWGYSHAVKEKSQNNHGTVLDLGEMRFCGFSGKLRLLIYRFARKNNLINLKKTFSIRHDVVSVKAKRIMPNREQRAWVRAQISFIQGIDAEFAELVGERIHTAEMISLRLLRRLEAEFWTAYIYTSRFLDQQNYCKIFMTNERTVIGRAVMLALKLRHCDYFVLESALGLNMNYEVFSKDFRNFEDVFSDKIESCWQSRASDPNFPDKIRFAREKKIKGIRPIGAPWQSVEILNKYDKSESIAIVDLLEKFKGKYLAFFPSTEMEMPAIEEVPGHPRTVSVHPQRLVFQELLIFAETHDLQLVVRVHPHPGEHFRQTFEDSIWKEFARLNRVTIIESASEITSNFVMSNSAVNLTYFSTIFVDSLISGYPALFFGKNEFFSLFPELFINDVGQLWNKLSQFRDMRFDLSRLDPWFYYSEVGGLPPLYTEAYEDKIYVLGQRFEQYRLSMNRVAK